MVVLLWERPFTTKPIKQKKTASFGGTVRKSIDTHGWRNSSQDHLTYLICVLIWDKAVHLWVPHMHTTKSLCTIIKNSRTMQYAIRDRPKGCMEVLFYWKGYWLSEIFASRSGWNEGNACVHFLGYRLQACMRKPLKITVLVNQIYQKLKIQQQKPVMYVKSEPL